MRGRLICGTLAGVGLSALIGVAVVLGQVVGSQELFITSTGSLVLPAGVGLTIAPDADQHMTLMTTGTGLAIYDKGAGPQELATLPDITLQRAFDTGTGQISGCSVSRPCEFRGTSLKSQAYELGGVWITEVRLIATDALVAVHRNVPAGLTHQILGNSVPIVTYTGTGALVNFEKAPTFTDGQKVVFNPNGTNAGLNVGAHTAAPSALANGDQWYDSTTNKFMCRENGLTVECIRRTLKKSLSLLSPTPTETNKVQWEWPTAVTLTEVSCSTDVGTATIQLIERARATPNSGGTDSMTADLVCSTTTATTTSFADSAIAANVPHSLEIVSVATAPTVVRIHMTATAN